MPKGENNDPKFISFDNCECPKCQQALARDEVEENLTEGKEFFTCPYCNQVSNIEDL